MADVTYRLNTDKKEGTYTLSPSFAERNGQTKYTRYYPGGSSIFVEDYEKSVLPYQDPMFEYNENINEPAMELVVSDKNTLLINYLESHHEFNTKNGFSVHDPENIAKKKSANVDDIQKALELIVFKSGFEVRAIAMAIFGADAYTWSDIKSESELKQKAIQDPKLIINAYQDDAYESKYLAALALFSGIMKENATYTEIVWSDDNKSVVIDLLQGETAIQKLATFLKEPSERQRLVFQEIGARLQKKQSEQSKVEIKTIVKDTPETVQLLSDKDNEIAELRAMLAKSKEVVSDDNLTEDVAEQPTKELTLEEAQKAYFKKFDKQVPPAQKNDLSWINKKLQE